MSLPRTPAEVTDEFLQGRVAEYRRHVGCSCSITLLEYLGMTADEYAVWFLTGQVPARVARTWSTRGV